jgi:hypothetical protein
MTGTVRRWPQSEAERRYREANRDKRRAADRKRRETATEQARERQRKANRSDRASVRSQVFDHYGWACACCGSSARPTIDHVNGDGQQHRREIRNGPVSSHEVYRWLIRNGFPDGFQTLCFPCNRSKSTEERCQLNHSGRVS